jgi:hypothetical protein
MLKIRTANMPIKPRAPKTVTVSPATAGHVGKLPSAVDGTGAALGARDGYTYRCLSASSAKYGPCEVCHGHVSEMWIRSDGRNEQTFGHRECLERDAAEKGKERV